MGADIGSENIGFSGPHVLHARISPVHVVPLTARVQPRWSPLQILTTPFDALVR